MDISVIIVNYKTPALLPACIDSVLEQRGVDVEVIVIDNASGDNTENVLKNYGDRITTIFNQENVGFGRANNQAFKRSQGEYVFLLNPDATFCENNALQKLLIYMQQYPQHGISGTRIIKSAQNDETLPAKSYPGEKYTKAKFKTLPGRIAWVLGAGMMIRRNVFEAVKGFDEDFFLYAEEADLCLRVRKAGYSIGYCKEVSIEHIGGASEKSTSPEHVFRKKHRGLHLFYRKHYSLRDAKRLVRRSFLRSSLRMYALSLKNRLGGLTELQWAKYYRYKAIRETAREFLS